MLVASVLRLSVAVSLVDDTGGRMLVEANELLWWESLRKKQVEQVNSWSTTKQYTEANISAAKAVVCCLCRGLISRLDIFSLLLLFLALVYDQVSEGFALASSTQLTGCYCVCPVINFLKGDPACTGAVHGRNRPSFCG